MKYTKLTDKIIISLIGCAFIFGGCSDETPVINSKNDTQMNIGHFVSVFDNSIRYKCANKIIDLSDNGEFQCQSFPISFYMDNVKLGEISSIHKDGYVFPQDIIVLEESRAVYSSDESMMFASLEE